MSRVRRRFLAIACVLLAVPTAAIAQQQRGARIGVLSASSAAAYASRVEGLRVGLRELGYVEGKNISIEYRWADGNYDRLPQLAAELVQLKVDVLVTQATPATRAAKQVTTTIPIVMVAVGDAVASGLVASFARPGANITGMTILSPELYGKRLALLKEAIPRIRKVAVLMNPDNSAYGPIFEAMGPTAKSLGIVLQRFDTRSPNEFEAVFAAMVKAKVDAVEIAEDPLFFVHETAIASHATRHRLPSVSGAEFVPAGSLIGYGVNRTEQFRRAAYFADRILKGTKPRDLPVEQPAKFDLFINLKTAKALSIKIPQSLLQSADKVIE